MPTITNNQSITIVKKNHAGETVWRYEGRVIKRTGTGVIIEAFFDRDDKDLGYITFRRGDRFVEFHYSDRWYNIFEVHNADDDRIKGWYCNLQRPAKIEAASVSADDLELDLFVYPDGRMIVLDREDFDALNIDSQERQSVLDALAALQQMVVTQSPPFLPQP